MNQTIKHNLLKLYHSQSEIWQKALMKDYLIEHPGISSSDDWLQYLTRMFELWKLRPGYLASDEENFISSIHTFKIRGMAKQKGFTMSHRAFRSEGKINRDLWWFGDREFKLVSSEKGLE